MAMPGPGQSVRTTCPYCGVGCGVLATTQPDGSTGIAGDPRHPANLGRLCSKGTALADVLTSDGRLLQPRVAGRRATWGRALDRIASAFRDTVRRHGPDSVALYVSGQLLTEDYYVANKLMKGFIGSANIDTNSRLCMASSVAGHKRAFGSDTVPGCYEDLEEADLVVLVGSNLAWCHPVLYQRLAAAKQARPSLQVVVVDPRRTATAELADLHLPLAPGSDVALFNGLLSWLDAAGARDDAYISRHTAGLDEALAAARSDDLGAVSGATGLPLAELQHFYGLFAANRRTVTVYSQGVNQSRSGTDKVNAILNCHLLTGRIGRAGMGPFSVTGQPNAMGGREVGGLANQLACHMELGNETHRALVQSFWHAPAIASEPGLKAVDLFQAVAQGRVKALWIMATNPVDSLPDADAVRAAIAACPFVAVSDVVADSDTAALANVLLPAAAWGEKDGTVTNSERRISRQRAFRPLPGEARPDWWALCQVARRLGFGRAFDYRGPADIFREYATLSALNNHGRRDFDIGGLADLSDAAYDSLSPVQWPIRRDGGGQQRFFADGGFFTTDGRARFVPTVTRLPEQPTPAFPLVLNTGRIRDQWHTMTRTGQSPRLSQHMAEPYVEMHPEDALKLGLSHAVLVDVRSARGAMRARLLVSPRQRRGSVFAPMHWTDQWTGAGRVDALVAPVTDPISGQPESKFTPVCISLYRAAWHGFAIVRTRPEMPELDYWAAARTEGGWRLELADGRPADDWAALARHLCGVGAVRTAEMLSYEDARGGQRRYAFHAGQRLLGALFVASEPVAVSRTWAAAWLRESVDAPGERLRLLAGRGGADRPDPGPLICSCFGVGANQIGQAAAGGRCLTVDAVGDELGAGSNCGSCRSEIQRIIDVARIKEAV